MTYTMTTTHQTAEHTNVIKNHRLTEDGVENLKRAFHVNATPGDTVTHKVTPEK